MSVTNKTFPQLCATICINEIEPRKKKHGFRPPPALVALMAFAEVEGATMRKDTRRYLDAFYKLAAERCL